MTTEEQIVYQILDVVNASEMSIDVSISEREIRAYMRGHRATILAKSTKQGHIIPDICFQDMGELVLGLNGSLYSVVMPTIIQFQNFTGLELYFKDGTPIPLGTKKSYHEWIKIDHAKHKPYSFLEANNFTLYPGISLDEYTLLKATIDAFVADPKIDARAILFNPEGVVTYDWTADPYPFPSELITTLKNQVLLREFKISLAVKPDQVGNSKDDDVRYHDQGKVLE